METLHRRRRCPPLRSINNMLQGFVTQPTLSARLEETPAKSTAEFTPQYLRLFFKGEHSLSSGFRTLELLEL